MATAARSISVGPVGVEPGQIPLPGAAELFAAMVAGANGDAAPGEEKAPEEAAGQIAAPAEAIIDASVLLPMLAQQRAAAPAGSLVAEPVVVSVKAQALASAQAQVVAKASGEPAPAEPVRQTSIARAVEPRVAAVAPRPGVDPKLTDGTVTAPVVGTQVDPKQPTESVIPTHKVRSAKLTSAEVGQPPVMRVQDDAKADPPAVAAELPRAAPSSNQAATMSRSPDKVLVTPVSQKAGAAPAIKIDAPVATRVETSRGLKQPAAPPMPTTPISDSGEATATIPTSIAPGTRSAEADPMSASAQAAAPVTTRQSHPLAVATEGSVLEPQQRPVVTAPATKLVEKPLAAKNVAPESMVDAAEAQTGPVAAKLATKTAVSQPVSEKEIALKVQAVTAKAQAPSAVATVRTDAAASQPATEKIVAPQVQRVAVEATTAAKATTKAVAPRPITAKADAPEVQAVATEAQFAPVAARARTSRVATVPGDIRVEPSVTADTSVASPTTDTRAAVQPLHAAPSTVQPLAIPAGAPLPNVAAALSQQVLDMSGGDAWIDQIARDISQTAGKDGIMRFRLAPETLGELKVEITQSERGAHVRLNVSSEGAQQALAAAEHKLAAEARAQGVRIAETEINFTGGQGRDASSFAREQGQQAQQQANHQPRTSRGNSANSFTSSDAAPEGRGRTDRYA